MKKAYLVKAVWDEEAKVWSAEGINFGGLATWAETIPQLTDKLKIMVPELLEAGEELEASEPEIPITLLMETAIIAHRPHA
ncbi:MAG: DUF1902 domain-containing protein [Alphaproteobacteria bacterium]|nr:DUF1902 domain-containing protein [Alphaproteobacteria bacterium]